MKNVTKKKTAGATTQKEAVENLMARTNLTASAAATEVKKAEAAKPAKKAPAKKTAAKANGDGKPKAATKTATIIEMLERKGGATAADLLKATGWQAHSLRGFIAGTLKKMGRNAESTKNAKGERVYAL